MHRRANGLSPELKLIDAVTQEEVEVDSLTVSRYETLSAADYHLGTLYIPHPKAMTPAQKSALEAIGGGIWDAGVSATRIFSSGASVLNLPIGSESPGQHRYRPPAALYRLQLLEHDKRQCTLMLRQRV